MPRNVFLSHHGIRQRQSQPFKEGWGYLALWLLIGGIAIGIVPGSVAQTSEDASQHVEPRRVDPLLIHGVYYLLVEQDLPRAAESFRRLLEKHPNHAEAHYFLARVLYEQGRLGQIGTDPTDQVERHLAIAQRNGLTFDRFHPDFRAMGASLPSAVPAVGAASHDGGDRKVPPALVFYAPDSESPVEVQSPDPFGLVRRQRTSPGSVLRLEAGQRYKLLVRQEKNWKSWLFPGILAALLAGVMIAR